MTITKPNGDIIVCTVEEYKQIYKPTMEVVNIPSVWFPSETSYRNEWTLSSTSTTLEENDE